MIVTELEISSFDQEKGKWVTSVCKYAGDHMRPLADDSRFRAVEGKRKKAIPIRTINAEVMDTTPWFRRIAQAANP